MPDTNTAYPAVKAEIDGRIMRFDNRQRLAKAVRRGDIGINSRVTYEESPNSITEMRAADCPMLTDLLAEFAEPEPASDGPSEATDDMPSEVVAEKESPETVPAPERDENPERDGKQVTPEQIGTDFNAIRTGQDLADFEDIYAPTAYRNDYRGDLTRIFRHKKARFWLIPDPEDPHKAYVVPGTEVLSNWADYGLSASDNPLKQHFDLLEGERMRLRHPAVMVRDDGYWVVLKKGVLEGIATGGAAMVPASKQEADAEGEAQDNEAFILAEEPKPEKKGLRNAAIIIGLLAVLGIVQVYRNSEDAGDGTPYEVNEQAPNICTGSGQGYVNQDMADRAEPLYLDRDTNIRVKAGASARRVGRADRGERFDLRRASEASSENWYQITSGPNCGHYVYSYADTPPDDQPPSFTRYINEVRTVEEPATIYNRPNGTGIGSVAAGSDVSLIGEVGNGFAEIIDPAQDNLLGYVEMSAFEKPPEPFRQAGLTIVNTCGRPVRVYLQADAVGLRVKGYTQMRAGENINVTNGRGRDIVLTDNVVQFYSEVDSPRMSISAIARWSPSTRTVTAKMGSNGKYELYAGCG